MEFNFMDMVNHHAAIIETIAAFDLKPGLRPDPHAANDMPVFDSFSELLGELHGRYFQGKPIDDPAHSRWPGNWEAVEIPAPRKRRSRS